jgi:DNA-binding response OmpR family regulator
VKILIAEDEKDLRMLLADQLSSVGYKVIEAENGAEALRLYDKEKPDMAILDIMMPVMDGLSVLSKIREASEMPIILLTARGEEIDKVGGLRLGADDYLVKPWSMNELLARIEVQKRHLKKDTEEKTVITSGSLVMDFGNGVVKKGDDILNLNAKEYYMLKFFAENMGRVVTKRQIYEAVWQDEYLYDDNTITVHISHLRSKIDEDEKNHIETLIGIGYRFT